MQTASDYGSYLANEASPLYTSTIVDRCTQKLVEDWNDMRCQVNPLALWYILMAGMAEKLCNRSGRRGQNMAFTLYSTWPAMVKGMQATPDGGQYVQTAWYSLHDFWCCGGSQCLCGLQ